MLTTGHGKSDNQPTRYNRIATSCVATILTVSLTDICESFILLFSAEILWVSSFIVFPKADLIFLY